jgi:hypothetical protein
MGGGGDYDADFDVDYDVDHDADYDLDDISAPGQSGGGRGEMFVGPDASPDPMRPHFGDWGDDVVGRGSSQSKEGEGTDLPYRDLILIGFFVVFLIIFFLLIRAGA